MKFLTIAATAAALALAIPATQAQVCKSLVCDKFQECDVYLDEEYCRDVCPPERCPTGQECVLQTVYCIRAPCPPIATCVNATKPPITATLPPITATLPPITKTLPPRCVLPCPLYRKCTLFGGKPYCQDTCAPGRCGANATCSLVQVQCIKAPCFPIVKCTPL